jgi:hypothetical protein
LWGRGGVCGAVRVDLAVLDGVDRLGDAETLALHIHVLIDPAASITQSAITFVVLPGGASCCGDNARKNRPPSAGIISAAVLDRLSYSRRKEIKGNEAKAIWQHETRQGCRGRRVGA